MTAPKSPADRCKVGRKPLAAEDRPVNAGVRLVPHWTARLDALLAGESRQSLASRLMREGIEREEKRRTTVGKVRIPKKDVARNVGRG